VIQVVVLCVFTTPRVEHDLLRVQNAEQFFDAKNVMPLLINVMKRPLSARGATQHDPLCVKPADQVVARC